MTRTVIGLFGSRREADLIVEHLAQEYGVPREDVRVFATNAPGGAEARSVQDTDLGASLRDLGLSGEELRLYGEGIRQGGILVAARMGDDRIERVRQAYAEYGARDIHARQTEWRGGPAAGA